VNVLTARSVIRRWASFAPNSIRIAATEFGFQELLLPNRSAETDCTFADLSRLRAVLGIAVEVARYPRRQVFPKSWKASSGSKSDRHYDLKPEAEPTQRFRATPVVQLFTQFVQQVYWLRQAPGRVLTTDAIRFAFYFSGDVLHKSNSEAANGSQLRIINGLLRGDPKA